MVEISYGAVLFIISAAWVTARGAAWMKRKKIDIKREMQLALVYICIVVIVRYTFFPFEKIGGKIQPLVFDLSKLYPPRINFVPFVHLFDYAVAGQANLNLIGNISMFIPVGIILPYVFKNLDTPLTAVGAGFLCSITIEILQLPFFGRVTDIDDIILNVSGYIIGYVIYRLSSFIVRQIKKNPHKS